jgi:hypothetical protein
MNSIYQELDEASNDSTPDPARDTTVMAAGVSNGMIVIKMLMHLRLQHGIKPQTIAVILRDRRCWKARTSSGLYCLKGLG